MSKIKSTKLVIALVLGVTIFATSGCSNDQQTSLPPGVMSPEQTRQAELADEANMTPQRQAAITAGPAAQTMLKPHTTPAQH
jgi:hypothetical protein